MKEVVFKELQAQLLRFNIATYLDFYQKYIYSAIDDSELIRELSKRKPPVLPMPDVLENKLILLRTIKIITLMEISKDIQEFDKNSKKLKNTKKKDLNDFDKTLKAFMKVPKPKDK